MFQSPIKKLVILAVILVVAGGLQVPVLRATEPSTEGKPAGKEDTWASRALAERFNEIQKLIKPQPGESRWMEIPWQTSLWTARGLAAKEGKPIFLWFGSGGSPACHT